VNARSVVAKPAIPRTADFAESPIILPSLIDWINSTWRRRTDGARLRIDLAHADTVSSNRKSLIRTKRSRPADVQVKNQSTSRVFKCFITAKRYGKSRVDVADGRVERFRDRFEHAPP
jgi:hypothetical protein